MRVVLQSPDEARTAVEFYQSPVFEGCQDGAIGVQVRALQVAPAVPEQVGVRVALEQRAVAGVPSVDDFALHVDEKRPETLAVEGSEKGEARMCQRTFVNDDTALFPRAQNLVCIRPDQVEYRVSVRLRLRKTYTETALSGQRSSRS